VISGLATYLRDVNSHGEIAVELRADGVQGDCPPDAEAQLIRIVQEALANVRKHSGVRQALVSLRRQDSVIQVVIADDGRGFDPAPLNGTDRPHFWLQTMRERAEAVGGHLTVDTGPDRGTRILVTLPERG
jgi:two-component system, NarL family, sensor histidine kinase DegS